MSYLLPSIDGENPKGNKSCKAREMSHVVLMRMLPLAAHSRGITSPRIQDFMSQSFITCFADWPVGRPARRPARFPSACLFAWFVCLFVCVGLLGCLFVTVVARRERSRRATRSASGMASKSSTLAI